ncbi:helix-turn-helix transcriptional regulator [Marinomonas sp. M1K-6]|uniref:Helix-turn-helix transcriptional regulator n=1 Tax=Marinomonas profundi TaxID=2726122 RepID=A0A847RA02_9GAMM|nr:helix-turn-helix transcriptional regulator [Marinomonas profundi]NLQ18007.1 helix-turn-helix transcriptional regulator [Marinomonas profundi]UDV01730.1 helix-turn-helix transcriptional regulator [Marinomonas profundi]
MANREEIGEKICAARKALKKTQKQMAEQTGIHKSTLSLIENGRFTGSLDILERYLDAVGLTLEVAPKKHRLPQWDEIEALFAEDD